MKVPRGSRPRRDAAATRERGPLARARGRRPDPGLLARRARRRRRRSPSSTRRGRRTRGSGRGGARWRHRGERRARRSHRRGGPAPGSGETSRERAWRALLLLERLYTPSFGPPETATAERSRREERLFAPTHLNVNAVSTHAPLKWYSLETGTSSTSCPAKAVKRKTLITCVSTRIH